MCFKETVAGSGVYCIKSYKSSNIYYINRDKKVIIDTGHPDDSKNNLKLLIDAGLTEDSVDFIISTHSHPDHVGGNKLFLDYFSRAQLIISDKYEEYCKMRSKLHLFAELEDKFDDFRISHSVKDYYELQLGNDTLILYYTPGHSCDSLSATLHSNNSIFSGDTLYNGIITQLDYHFDPGECLCQLKKSYDLIQKLAPDIIFAGHGDFFYNSEKLWLVFNRKIDKFSSNEQHLFLNNMIPIFELYFDKNKGVNKNELYKDFGEYIRRFDKANILKSGVSLDLEWLVERALVIMTAMNIIRNQDERYFLNSELNSHL